VGGDGEKHRAVKEIKKKDARQSGSIDYSRELEAIAKFSHEKVCPSARLHAIGSS